jgi:hypothetical protein
MVSIPQYAGSSIQARARLLPRDQHVARRDALEAVSDRPFGGPGRLARGRKDPHVPLTNDVDADGLQVINWVAEIQAARNGNAGLEPAR